MKEKTINEFVKEFHIAFGGVEFKATQTGTGLTVASKGWVEPTQKPRLEISGDDFIALGKLGRGGAPGAGVVSEMLMMMGCKKCK